MTWFDLHFKVSSLATLENEMKRGKSGSKETSWRPLQSRKMIVAGIRAMMGEENGFEIHFEGAVTGKIIKKELSVRNDVGS